MSENGWTKGPWKISGVSMNDGSISVSCPEQRIVVACVTNAASLGDFVAAAIKGRRDFGAPDTAKTQYANAHLIAAAPALAEALEAIDRLSFDMTPGTMIEMRRLARAALASAKGST